jgi:hypothetical protein
MIISEKVNDNQVCGYKRRQKKNHDASEEESPPKLCAELAPALRADEVLVHLTAIVKDEVQNGEAQNPLHSFGEELSIVQQRQRNRQIQNILVEQCDQVIFPPHETIGDVLCVEPFL